MLAHAPRNRGLQSLRVGLVQTLVSPQPFPIGQHPPHVVKRGIPTSDDHDSLDLIRLPEIFQDLIHGARLQARFVVDEGIVAVFVTVLVQTDDSEDILHFFEVDHVVDDTQVVDMAGALSHSAALLWRRGPRQPLRRRGESRTGTVLADGQSTQRFPSRYPTDYPEPVQWTGPGRARVAKLRVRPWSSEHHVEGVEDLRPGAWAMHVRRARAKISLPWREGLGPWGTRGKQ